MLKRKERLLVIGLGPRGQRVVAAARRRFTDRWGALGRVAWLSLDNGRDVAEPLRESVQALTRLGHEALTETARWYEMGGTARVCVVTDLAETGNDATHVAEAARRALTDLVDVRVWGMAVLSDGLAAPTPPASSLAAHLMAWSASRDGIPCFDGGRLVIGSANRYGATLSEAERDNLAAEVVVQWLTGPLAETDGLDWLDGDGFSSAGVAAWVYPVTTLRQRLGERIATRLLDAWLGDGEAGLDSLATEREGLATLLSLDEQRVQATVTPTEALDDLLQPLWLPPAVIGGLWDNEAVALQAQFDARLEALTQRRPQMDERAAALTSDVVRDLALMVDRWLDEPTVGAVAWTQTRLGVLRNTVKRLTDEAHQTAERRFRELEALDAEREALVERMAEAAELLPQGGLGLLGLALRPWRLPGAWRSSRLMRTLAVRLAAVLERGLAATADVLRADLATTVYDEVADQSRQLADTTRRLGETLGQARQALRPSQDGLFGAPDFPLEVSVLTPPLVEALAATVEPDPVVALKEASLGHLGLSGWLASPVTAEAVAEACRAYGWQRTEPLAALTADELMGRRFEGSRRLGDALHDLVAAAAPFLHWDEARAAGSLGGSPRLSRWLGVAEGEHSALASCAVTLSPTTRVVTTGDSGRVLAMQTVQGISLEMLTLNEEVQDGSRQDAPMAVE